MCDEVDRYPVSAGTKDKPEPVMKCIHCGALHGELEWKAGQIRGQWLGGAPSGTKTRSFHMNAFASPWTSWAQLIDQFAEAYRGGEETLKVWWNTKLGLPWENRTGTVEVEALETHREEYGAELPDGVTVLTCGVDTQDDRLEAEVVGWGAGKESWGIEYKVLYGDPGQAEVWAALDEFLSRTWAKAGGEELGLSCTCVDSAGHYTDEVYRFCKPRARRNVFAIIGRGDSGRPSVSKPTRNNRRRVPLFTLGVSTLKGTLFSRLKVEKPGPGYCHFPIEPKTNHRGYDAPYFKGLLSERMVVRRLRGKERVEWEPRAKGLRNEPLDTRVYATGALEIFNPDLEKEVRRALARQGTGKASKPPETSRPPEPEPGPAMKAPTAQVKVPSRPSVTVTQAPGAGARRRIVSRGVSW